MRTLTLAVAVSVVSACNCLHANADRTPCTSDGGCEKAGDVCAADMTCGPPGGTGGGGESCTCQQGEVCSAGVCYPTSCGTEACGAGFACVGGVCRSLDCLGVLCPGGEACVAGACVTLACSDGTKNGTESGVDCGGDCPGACPMGESCRHNADCTSLLCVAGHCTQASCMDGVINGPETDVDCGGAADAGCPRCGDGKACASPVDCVSGVCMAGHCSTPSCADGVRNGAELGIDCGAGCPGCADGTACDGGSDCDAGACTTGQCGKKACTIATVDYVETAHNPANDCQECRSGTTSTAWSNRTVTSPCTAAGAAGLCRGSTTLACCTGCWNATGNSCQPGQSIGACGVGGAACGSCPCNNDTCTTGTCVPAPGVSLDVVSGDGWTCRRDSNRALACWGDNSAGQLAQGNTTDTFIPTAVGSATDWLQLSARGMSGSSITNHLTCGIRMGGNLWCWGGNNKGQLGIGNMNMSNLPEPVGASGEWASVGVGGIHVCAVKTDGSLWCWGQGSQLGLGPSPGDRSTPARVGTDNDWQSVSGTSAQGNNGSVSFYNGHTCAIKTSGALYCWGIDGAALGLGGTDFDVPTRVGTGVDWLQVSAASSMIIGCGCSSPIYTCAVTKSGTLWCWGNNVTGALGLGDKVTRDTPAMVPGTNWAQVSVGTGHACAVKKDGTLWCWGAGLAGALGQGNTTEQLSPVQVGTASDWVNVSCGAAFTCATRSDKTLWCFGTGNRLGRGTGQGNSTTPIRVCQ